MTGLAEDGGLLLPRAIPRIDRATFESWQPLSYSKLAYEVMSFGSVLVEAHPRDDEIAAAIHADAGTELRIAGG